MNSMYESLVDYLRDKEVCTKYQLLHELHMLFPVMSLGRLSSLFDKLTKTLNLAI